MALTQVSDSNNCIRIGPHKKRFSVALDLPAFTQFSDLS